MAIARAHRREISVAFAAIVSVSLLFGCAADRRAGMGPDQIAQAEATGKLHQCASCHGEDGVSTADIFPNLAGQQKAYLAAQLTALRDHTRQDRDAKSYMWGMARGLSDATIQVLAADYAAKPPATVAGSAAGAKTEIAAGEAIFKNGVPAHGVLACVSCHGAKAEGAAVIPGLAGQHRDYLVVQLGAFASGARDNAAMHLIAKGMTPEEMKAVATYVSSL